MKTMSNLNRKMQFYNSVMTYFLAIMIGVSISSCKSHKYTIVSYEHTNMLVDARYDNGIRADVTAFVEPYKSSVDSLYSPVVGKAACDMSPERPEGKLNNLIADIMMWGAKKYGENPVVAISNIGGIRASLSKGNVTKGNVIDIAPFSNHLFFMTLKGSQLIKIFEQMAVTGGECVSHGVEALITKDGKLVSLHINGEPVDNNSDYRIVTVDYLSEGNDGITAFQLGTDRKNVEDNSYILRNLIENYFLEKLKTGEEVDSKLEGRITLAE